MNYVSRSTLYRAPTLVGRKIQSTFNQLGKPSVGSLSTIVRTYKAAVTRTGETIIAFQYRLAKKLLGPVFRGYEHILRDQTDYEHKAAYILANPLNWKQDEENPHTIRN